MPPTNLELSYAAGILDGEGCIRVNFQGKNRNPTIRAQITNTNLELIVLFKNWFGGNITEANPSRYNPNAKDSYVWEVAAKTAAMFLEQVLPFLRVKKPQALLALDLQSTKNRHYGFNKPIPQEVVNHRLILASKISALNKKGRVA